MPTEIYLSKANSTETQTIKADELLPTDSIVETIAPEKDDEETKLKINKRPEWYHSFADKESFRMWERRLFGILP